MNDKRILLIEDNPDDELLTIRAFKEAGYVNNVVIVRDGAEALDYVFNQNKYVDKDKYPNPELILLDLKLPKVDGRDVLKGIRQNSYTRFIPIIILTSSIEETDICSCYELQGNSYIRKPIDFGDFKRVIKSICEYWLEFNHPVPQVKLDSFVAT